MKKPSLPFYFANFSFVCPNYENQADLFIGSQKLESFFFSFELKTNKGKPKKKDFSAWIDSQDCSLGNSFLSIAYQENLPSSKPSESKFSKLFQDSAWQAFKQSDYFFSF